jgi:hypothetical protein
MADPLVISLKLLDQSFNIAGERIVTLGDRYPNVLWIPGELVEETYLLPINPSALPGLYQLEISLIRQDKTLPAGFAYLPLTQAGEILGQNLYPLAVRLLDPAHDKLPATRFSAQIGKNIHLTGYDLAVPAADSLTSPLALSLYWQATASIPTDYTVFTQLIGPDGQVWAQWDNPPQAGRYPTTAWQTPDQVIDRYTLTPREGAPAGEYRLIVGMYDPNTGERLPATIDGQPQPDNALVLTTISLN